MIWALLIVALSLNTALADCYQPYGVHCRNSCDYWNGACKNGCEAGWHGSRCDGMCAPGCNDCDGALATQCRECCDNAHYDNQSKTCVCNEGWEGRSCDIAHSYGGMMDPNYHDQYVQDTYYNGQENDHYFQTSNSGNGYCDPKCIDCTGPTARDCVSCVSHCSKDQFGYCGCSEYWSGDDCSIYSGPCHPSCYRAGGCSGPDASDCTSCFPHASRDAYGKCVCDPYWTGYDCSKYIGQCDAKCYGCHGATDEECDMCIQHAVKDEYNRCSCQGDWTGADCKTYTGTCDSKCSGCKGPEDKDCDYCTAHSTWDGYGRCVCDAYWTGSDCSSYVGFCDALCIGCTGPTSKDCKECTTNGTQDSFGTCQCKDHWSGESCSTFTGHCDSKCNGCHGSTPGDCDFCVPHATRDKYGACACDENWIGESCSQWQGSCDPRCDFAHGCNGATNADCNFCGFNTNRTEAGYCVCDENWTGEDCRIFMGECDPICRGCNGPDACDCETCVEHASRDANGFCVCEGQWQGSDCSQYVGNCHPRCNGCVGPTDADCVECETHAEWFNSGPRTHCICNAYWTGLDCSEYYGVCDYKCHPDFGCSGPDAGHCFECNTNAEWRDGVEVPMGPECDCKPDWIGKNCFTYDGPCDCLCADESCMGPGPKYCNSCVTNSSRNEEGACQCHDDWVSKDCDLYRGQCHPCCLSCSGPTEYDCLTSSTKTMIIGGKCSCTTSWAGDDCSRYRGVCAPCCNGCFGPNITDCLSIVENAMKGADGSCSCQADYLTEDNCSVYDGDCHCSCSEGCYGPFSHQCKECHMNSFRDNHGECVCHPGYGGCDCSQYTGPCPTCCESCSGQSGECLSCLNHSSLDGSGNCVADANWGGDLCNNFYGVCDCSCDGCTGPSKFDCIKCSANSHFDNSGNCVCKADQGGDCCEIYQGSCDCQCSGATGPDFCSGPDAIHCSQCNSNSHRHNVTGECTCDLSWEGQCCDSYSGQCPCNCEACDMSGACLGCRENSTANATTGECECDTGYGGECCEFLGDCPCNCKSCTGPNAVDCTSCDEHSGWNSGVCECFADWTVAGEDCCAYSGTCDCKCADKTVGGCSGPSTKECNSCGPHAHRDATGSCVCDSYWGGSCCQDYTGPCDWRCEVCTGPTNTDCVGCTGNFQGGLDAGTCICAENWSGVHCDRWIGECNKFCIGCAAGSGPEHCDSCVLNAARNPDGECECLTNWLEDDCCATWEGACHCSCSDTCSGPEAEHCDSCKANAYWNDYGECQCESCWASDGCCSSYSCACDCKCANGRCNGPSDGECTECAENSHSEPIGGIDRCVCDDNFGGDCCTEYIGQCHCLCDGCFGDDTASCVSCGPHAHLDNNGLCVCNEGWSGDCCTERPLPCAPHCVECNDTGVLDCTLCQDGYAIALDGSCQACNECCETCTGIGASECESCFTGYFLSVNTCERCDPSCNECEGTSTTCTQCSFEAVLEDPGTCDCDSPFFRDNFTATCTKSCWHLEASSTNPRVCTPTVSIDEFYLGNAYPQTGVNSVKLDWCRTPTPIENRGGYFDGHTNSLEVTNWSTYPEARFSLWFKGTGANGTLFSLDGLFWDGQDQYWNKMCDWQDCLEEISGGLIEVWITPCGSIGLQFGGYRFTSVEESYVGGWSYVSFSYMNAHSLAMGYFTEALTLSLNGDSVHTTTVSDQVFPEWNPTFHIGSYRGFGYNFEGFIHSFQYTITTSQAATNFLTTGCTGDCTMCPDYQQPGTTANSTGECLSMCNYNQYIDSTGACGNCHPGCKDGCTLSDLATDFATCMSTKCHETCETCTDVNGTLAESCLTCPCGSSRTNAMITSSCCECEQGFYWDDESQWCKPDCVEGCKICSGLDKDECLVCEEGWALNPNKHTECIPCEKNLFYENDFNCADAAETRPVTGSCLCEDNQWFDQVKCQDCKEHCRDCDDSGNCESCKDGYTFLKGFNCCQDSCPTGQFELDIGQCSGICGIVGDFSFRCENKEQNIKWTYTGIYEHVDDSTHNWSVKVYGGDGDGSSSADPYAVDDRGLWFDGRYNYLTVKGLILHPTHTNIFWAKPHGDGTLFSSNRYDGFDSYVISIMGQRLMTEVTSAGFSWMPEVDFITTFVWQNLAVSATWNEVDNTTTFTLYRDNEQKVQGTISQHGILDRPDWESTKLIGGYLTNNNLRGMYTGYIFQYRVTSTAVDNYDTLVLKDGNCDDGLAVCPADGFALGICNWNSYWNGLKCARCPSWCNRGCQSDSSCTNNADHYD